ncbi:alpha-glucuronidase family glycosyl hydrolase [Echinicola jeungdonensis]|uniref:Xylan alpha-1,2-glucuronidase n=1 Tax=Echinicola jeungdonensis TaxID=709343 RepID=A0ABV5J9X1_9BACT|nr:alpha-glucuronidase family glycosyl hydrolase [Echinicola jeungdonensis]MDN3670420.1 alpha-glucuronidase family glycosyl hydrolase [Echinicola jeungdonensis]
MKRPSFFLFVLVSFCLLYDTLYGKDGYNLWLQYAKIESPELVDAYRKNTHKITLPQNSSTTNIIKNELTKAFKGMLLTSPEFSEKNIENHNLVIGTRDNFPWLIELVDKKQLDSLGQEGFIIKSTFFKDQPITVITGNSDLALLYGTFEFLKLIQTHKSISDLNITSIPKTKIRVLNHWDNLDRSVERGYAGSSIWNWHLLPDHIDQQYLDYARANASIGINGTVLTNVNANALVLTPSYLKKAAALAEVFRPYGIKVYLTARFSAPIEIGNLKTADPLDKNVQKWWKEKAEEIYSYIPNFGGFLVKADSEGQPGPHNYGRTQADGANLLAQALKPFGGIVMWRAFVYSEDTPDDRAKQAYNEFKPLDGKFDNNVLVQVKNGPIDFQPREPVHPLFGAMPQTPLMMEFQITQEYLGQGTHLVYLSKLYEEILSTDINAKGPGSTVAKIIDGSLENHPLSGMAGVSNIGTARNWTGNHFGQANWYAFGKLAWNPYEKSEKIAKDWIEMTFSSDPQFINTSLDIMMESHEAVVNYMTPLGLHHIMDWNHHYGPGPWVTDKHRDDWTSTYYHQAGADGIGFDRTSSGSNALSQYSSTIQNQFTNLKTCPEKYLLWFHHLPWSYQMQSGKTLWEELAFRYQKGVDQTTQALQQWSTLEGKIDDERYKHILSFLKIQEKEAKWWKNACLLYFQQFSKSPLPQGVDDPKKTLEDYKKYNPQFVPGI